MIGYGAEHRSHMYISTYILFSYAIHLLILYE